MAKVTMQSDPVIYSRGLSKCPPDRKRALSLDLSLSTGAGMMDFDPTKPIVDETLFLDLWDLSVGAFDSNILRVVRLRSFLVAVNPDVIFLEDVKFDPPTSGPGGRPLPIGMVIARAATSLEFQGGLKTTVTTWAQERGIPCAGFAVGAIKKSATGKGVANKSDMVIACNKKFGTKLDPKDCEKTGVDNMADAAHVMLLGLELYAKGMS